ncbi:MAG: hypothetical protein NTU89_03030, partial [Candidatus Dependentiae bacterium]|nr:hypothetical protein [Candidatus Dependentiae bacterium]
MSMVKKILLFQASIIFSASSVHAMSQSKPRLGLGVTKLKGTHTILSEYAGCSPFYGLVFAEKNVLRNLYEFSSFYNKSLGEAVLKDASPDLDIIKKEVGDYLNQDRSTGTQNLVRQMFNMPPGGTFNPTNAPNNPVAQLKPKDIGKILRIMNDFSSDAVKMELGLKNYMQSLGLKDPQGKPFVGK